MAPFNLNSRYVEQNPMKIVALRNHLVQKKIEDEDLQRDEVCNAILKGPFSRITQNGPSAYNSLRNYIMKDQGGVKRYLQLPIWRVCPPLAVATFNKRIQNAVPRESDFQQISTTQARMLVQELFDSKDVDEEMVRRYRALSKLLTNAECEIHVPKRHSKSELIQFLRDYLGEKLKPDDEVIKKESESDECEQEEPRKKGHQERDSSRTPSAECKTDMTELNEVMSKLLSGDHVDFLTYAMAVHSTFLKTYANLQRWDRIVRQQATSIADPDTSITHYGKHERKSHRRSLPSKH